jgi:hypothetical protein
MTYTTEQRAVFNAAFRVGQSLGRKFETSDLTPELRQAARLYAACYDGDFPYMVEMAQSATGGVMFFSDGQSKGILNCLMADAKRRMEQRGPKVVVAGAAREQDHQPAPSRVYLQDLPDGRYRVTLPDGDHLALYIKKAGPESKLAGSRVISTRVNGDDWMGVAHVRDNLHLWRSCQGQLRVRVYAALDVLDQAKTQDEWLVAGLAFAQEGSQCFICGRDLDTPESLTAGYGPTCADKHGLPWGAKAVPMSVRLAQQTAAANATVEAPAEPHIDPETGVQESAEELLDLVEATRQAPKVVSLSDARARGYKRTYEEIFGEDAL